MNWKGLKGLVLLLSITLAFPSSAVHAAVQRSSQKHRTDTSQKFSSKGHSSLATFPSSELYESGTKHDHQTADSKETPLIRLKRIKRQTEKAASSSSVQGSTSNWPGTPINPGSEVLRIHDKSSLINGRTTNAASSDRRKFSSASHSGAYRDRDSAASSRIHTKMLRKKETANNRNANIRGGKGGHGTGKVLPTTRKSNEISEPLVQTAVGHHHKSSSSLGTGGYFHHRNEQNRLESAAEFALRQRTPHKKTKHLKNRSELDHLQAGGRNGGHSAAAGAALSRPRPVGSAAEETASFGGQAANRYHDATVKARGRGRVVPIKAGGQEDGSGEISHRSRRGQHSGTTAVNGGGGGGHGQKKVRAELEHIKRMQRDLMKEISHLEHMKKKKKKVQRRSASSSSSSSSSSSIHQQNHRQQIAKANRK